MNPLLKCLKEIRNIAIIYRSIFCYERGYMRRKHIGYIRVSTKEQARNGYSLDFQKIRIKEYFEKLNIKRYSIYVDDGYSATNEERPEYKRIKQEIYEGIVVNVVVFKMDRLHRNVNNCNDFVNLCLEHGTQLISLTENIDYKSAMGRAFNNISSTIAQLESDLISERTKNGLVGKAIKGEYPFKGTIYGYDKIDSQLKINKNQSRIINYIFTNYTRKPAKVKAEIQELYKVDLSTQKIYNIKKNFYFYKTGKVRIKDSKYLVAVPILVNKKTIYRYENHLKSKKNRIEKSNQKNKEYKYSNLIYYNDEKLKNKSAYGRNKNKYLYYVSKDGNIRISEIELDYYLQNRKLIMENENNKILLKECNKYLNNEITDEELLVTLKMYKRKSQIKRIDLLENGGVKVEYKE